MNASTHSMRSFKTNLRIAAVTFVVIGYAISAHSQQTTSAFQAADIDVSQLKPGMCIEVWMKVPSSLVQSGLPDDADNGGIVHKITQDEIIATQHHECTDIYGIPIISALPFVGRFFTKTDTRSWETTSRIPIKEIAEVKVLQPNQTR